VLEEGDHPKPKNFTQHISRPHIFFVSSNH
jgi:hypothetical protein